MAERIAGSAVTVLDECGHWTTLERPEGCTQELLKFHARFR
jgi:pimeloyl-ACP methyl ester carboxylesterase